MIRIFSILILILFIVLLPPAALAYASQDAIPGDQLYPVKRKLEDIILSLAAVSPTTRTWFALAYSKRRFSETTSLITKKENTAASQTLKELVDQTSSVASQIQAVNDASQKTQLKEQLKTSIVQYQQGLNAAKTTLDQTQPLNPTPTPDPSGQIIPSPTPSTSTTVSNADLQRQIDEANKKLQEINDQTQSTSNNTPPPASDDSDLNAALTNLNAVNVDGLSSVLSQSTSKLSSFIVQ